uniref:Uncharacterized protein n=1 Tax=Amphimedon queenslandica TaxID=400682 RepID=A0A1X7VNU5_AMPQE
PLAKKTLCSKPSSTFCRSADITKVISEINKYINK